MGLIENVKELAALAKAAGNTELYRQILDLQVEVMDLTQANRELQECIHNLEEAREQAERMTFRPPFFYTDDDEIPHCPRCWEVDHKAVHYPEPFRSAAGPVYTCPECDKEIIHPRDHSPSEMYTSGRRPTPYDDF
jgi:hypothetical protein